jgi:hypothetical protein
MLMDIADTGFISFHMDILTTGMCRLLVVAVMQAYLSLLYREVGSGRLVSAKFAALLPGRPPQEGYQFSRNNKCVVSYSYRHRILSSVQGEMPRI